MLKETLQRKGHTHNINSPSLPSEPLNGTSKAKWGCVNPPQSASGLKCDQSRGCTDRWAHSGPLTVKAPGSFVGVTEDLREARMAHHSKMILDVHDNPKHSKV